MIRLNCFFQSKEDRLDDALAAAKELTAASLKQDGCIAYDVFASATSPGVLLICETWRDEAALAAHSASEPFVKNVAIINDCGLLVNSSRGIIYAGHDEHFAETAADAAKNLQEQMAEQLALL